MDVDVFSKDNDTMAFDTKVVLEQANHSATINQFNWFIMFWDTYDSIFIYVKVFFS